MVDDIQLSSLALMNWLLEWGMPMTRCAGFQLSAADVDLHFGAGFLGWFLVKQGLPLWNGGTALHFVERHSFISFDRVINSSQPFHFLIIINININSFIQSITHQSHINLSNMQTISNAVQDHMGPAPSIVENTYKGSISIPCFP